MRAWMSWSSGKDSTMALAAVRADPQIMVTGLLTTVNAEADRVAMHGVRRALLQAQAARLGLPVHVVELPSPCPNHTYEEQMAEALQVAADQSVEAVVFGDLFLADIRAYREAAMEPTGLRAVFPLWGSDTRELAERMIASGVEAVLTCVDTAQLDAAFVGRRFDASLLADLPATADPCGENGEFHTLVTDGPGFASPIPVRTGRMVRRDRFVFIDVLPSD